MAGPLSGHFESSPILTRETGEPSINSSTIFVDDLPIRDPLNLMKRVTIYCRQALPDTEHLSCLRKAVEARGDTVVATFIDDGRIVGRGKYAGWNKLVSILDQVDQVAVADAGDLPGRSVVDLLKILDLLRDHGVGLFLHDERIDTSGSGFTVLDLISVYRRAKLSQAIRRGQARAVEAGKRIGRPIVPYRIQDRIRAALADGGGIRPTARRLNVSPATVINIRRTIFVSHKSQDDVAGHCTNP
jgi:DNA invertase Pin-like site-specific DNA recombinase